MYRSEKIKDRHQPSGEQQRSHSSNKRAQEKWLQDEPGVYRLKSQNGRSDEQQFRHQSQSGGVSFRSSGPPRSRSQRSSASPANNSGADDRTYNDDRRSSYARHGGDRKPTTVELDDYYKKYKQTEPPFNSEHVGPRRSSRPSSGSYKRSASRGDPKQIVDSSIGATRGGGALAYLGPSGLSRSGGASQRYGQQPSVEPGTGPPLLSREINYDLPQSHLAPGANSSASPLPNSQAATNLNVDMNPTTLKLLLLRQIIQELQTAGRIHNDTIIIPFLRMIDEELKPGRAEPIVFCSAEASRGAAENGHTVFKAESPQNYDLNAAAQSPMIIDLHSSSEDSQQDDRVRNNYRSHGKPSRGKGQSRGGYFRGSSTVAASSRQFSSNRVNKALSNCETMSSVNDAPSFDRSSEEPEGNESDERSSSPMPSSLQRPSSKNEIMVRNKTNHKGSKRLYIESTGHSVSRFDHKSKQLRSSRNHERSSSRERTLYKEIRRDNLSQESDLTLGQSGTTRKTIGHERSKGSDLRRSSREFKDKERAASKDKESAKQLSGGHKKFASKNEDGKKPGLKKHQGEGSKSLETDSKKKNRPMDHTGVKKIKSKVSKASGRTRSLDDFVSTTPASQTTSVAEESRVTSRLRPKSKTPASLNDLENSDEIDNDVDNDDESNATKLPKAKRFCASLELNVESNPVPVVSTKPQKEPRAGTSKELHTAAAAKDVVLKLSDIVKTSTNNTSKVASSQQPEPIPTAPVIIESADAPIVPTPARTNIFAAAHAKKPEPTASTTTAAPAGGYVHPRPYNRNTSHRQSSNVTSSAAAGQGSAGATAGSGYNGEPSSKAVQETSWVPESRPPKEPLRAKPMVRSFVNILFVSQC